VNFIESKEDNSRKMKFSMIDSNINHFFSLQTLVLLLVGLVLAVLVTVEAAPTHQVKKNVKN